MDELYEAAQRILKEYQLTHGLNGDAAPEYNPVIWSELADEEFELEWLVDGLWPTGKHLHLFAAHKTGKSLVSLHIAVSIAMGRDPFTGAAIPPHEVTYIDKEMTRQDLQERLFDMGLTAAMKAGALDSLHYHFYPNIGYLDTVEGGLKLMQWVEKDNSDVVILDTLSRVVKGEENSNDTYRNFYNCTGALLKANGVAMLRLDHEGHQAGHSRGASSKADDVDLVYHLKTVDQGLELTMKFARIAYVRKTLTLVLGTDLLGFSTSDHKMWPAGTLERARELETLGCPEGMSFRKTQKWLRDNDHPVGKNEVLSAAIKYRNERVDIPGLES
jgi:RecA-family ATPase